jgi:uncharacterized membrane protein YfcA
VIVAALIGILAGIVAGLFGVGGGTIFVPALVIFAGLGHVEAEATSLLAMIPVALVGAWRQRRYGNLELREGVMVGTLAAGGAVLGVLVANSVPERALELGFAALMLFAAWQLVRKALREAEDGADGG